MKRLFASLKASAAVALVAAAGLVAAPQAEAQEMEMQEVADLLHLVMSSDRTIYTKMVVNRLAVKEKVIKASEHYIDDKALVLPAQMFRMGAELVAEETDAFSYSLLSTWPINKQNAPVTDLEAEGLAFIEENVGENFYGEEELGGVTYFTAVYPDIAVAEACTSCHNEHKDSPRTDFDLGEVMGGVVIRIPIDS